MKTLAPANRPAKVVLHDTLPTVILDREALKDIEALVSVAEQPFLFFGETTLDGDDVVVSGVSVPKQVLKDDSFTLLEELGSTGFVGFYIHNDTRNENGQARYCRQLAGDSEDLLCVAGTFDKDGRASFDVYLEDYGVVVQGAEWKIAPNESAEERSAFWAERIQERVKPDTTTWTPGSTWSSRGAKQESWFDRHDDDFHDYRPRDYGSYGSYGSWGNHGDGGGVDDDDDGVGRVYRSNTPFADDVFEELDWPDLESLKKLGASGITRAEIAGKKLVLVDHEWAFDSEIGSDRNDGTTGQSAGEDTGLAVDGDLAGYIADFLVGTNDDPKSTMEDAVQPGECSEELLDEVMRRVTPCPECKAWMYLVEGTVAMCDDCVARLMAV